MSDFYKLYEDALNDYMFGRKDQAISNARCWISECDENPFEEGTQAHELFFQAKKNYKLWSSSAINNRVSGRRCEKNIAELLSLEIPNPYTKNMPVVEKDPIHVLGVVPDAKVIETEDGKGSVELKSSVESKEVKAEKTEEPEKHGIFRKKR